MEGKHLDIFWATAMLANNMNSSISLSNEEIGGRRGIDLSKQLEYKKAELINSYNL